MHLPRRDGAVDSRIRDGFIGAARGLIAPKAISAVVYGSFLWAEVPGDIDIWVSHDAPTAHDTLAHLASAIGFRLDIWDDQEMSAASPTLAAAVRAVARHNGRRLVGRMPGNDVPLPVATEVLSRHELASGRRALEFARSGSPDIAFEAVTEALRAAARARAPHLDARRAVKSLVGGQLADAALVSPSLRAMLERACWGWSQVIEAVDADLQRDDGITLEPSSPWVVAAARSQA